MGPIFVLILHMVHEKPYMPVCFLSCISLVLNDKKNISGLIQLTEAN